MPWREDTLRNLQDRIGAIRFAGEADAEIPNDIVVTDDPAVPTRMAGQVDIPAPEAFVPDRQQSSELSYATRLLRSGQNAYENSTRADGQYVVSDPLHASRMRELGVRLGDLSNFRTSEDLNATLAEAEDVMANAQEDPLRLQQPLEPFDSGERPASLRSQVHPAVAEFLDRRGELDQAIENADRHQLSAFMRDRREARWDAEHRVRAAEQAESRRETAAMDPSYRQRQLDAMEIDRQRLQDPHMSSTDISDLRSNLQADGYIPIPGLLEDLESGRKQAAMTVLGETLAKYPEVEQLLLANRLGSEGRLRNPEQYMPYVDTEQTKVTPADRATLYNRVLGSSSPDLLSLTKGILTDFDEFYTSGEPALQAKARQIMTDLGFGKELASVETKVFNPKAPVIGGGGYVTDVGKSPEFKYIEGRAREVNKAINNLENSGALTEAAAKYPGLEPDLSYPEKRYLDVDPDTGAVIELSSINSDQVLNDAYGVKVMGAASPRTFRLIDPMDIRNSTVSKNALKFFVDHPIAGNDSISFMTKMPGGDFDYSARGTLPPAVAKAVNSIVQQGAFENSAPGMLASNSPIDSDDLFHAHMNNANDIGESSTLRKLEPFHDQGQEFPYLRAHAYQSAGFGGLDRNKEQLGYVDLSNRVVPVQLRQGHRTESGAVRMMGGDNPSARVFQDVLPASKSTYYSGLPVNESINPRSLAAGAGFALLNEELPKQVQQGNYAGAAKTIAKDVGTGVVADIGIGAAARQLASRAPVAASRILPVAGQVGPVMAGAGLFAQGKQGSLLDVVTQGATKRPVSWLPAAGQVDPRTHAGARASRAIGNEGAYILRQLQQGRIPYSR